MPSNLILARKFNFSFHCIVPGPFRGRSDLTFRTDRGRRKCGCALPMHAIVQPPGHGSLPTTKDVRCSCVPARRLIHPSAHLQTHTRTCIYSFIQILHTVDMDNIIFLDDDILYCNFLKMGGISSSKTEVSIYKSLRCYELKDQNPLHRSDSLKSQYHICWHINFIPEFSPSLYRK